MPSAEAAAVLTVQPVRHPFAIIVSQDCDLEQDFNYRFHQIGNKRHELPSILLCQAVAAEELTKGRHRQLFKSKTFRGNFKNNNDFRFHFVQAIPPAYDTLQEGLPELGMEFKRYFSIPTAEIYRRIELAHTRRRAQLKSPYREHFCNRFYNFNNRIALPEEYESI